jgi:hypothetical protein
LRSSLPHAGMFLLLHIVFLSWVTIGHFTAVLQHLRNLSEKFSTVPNRRYVFTHSKVWNKMYKNDCHVFAVGLSVRFVWVGANVIFLWAECYLIPYAVFPLLFSDFCFLISFPKYPIILDWWSIRWYCFWDRGRFFFIWLYY